MATEHATMRLVAEAKALRERLRLYEGQEQAAAYVEEYAAPLSHKDSLQQAGNRTTSNDMTATREEIDAKLAASEARTETRFAEMNGKFDLMLSKMDALSQSLTQSLVAVQESQRDLKGEMDSLRQETKNEWRQTRNTQWAAAALLLALIGLAASFWSDGIDLGSKISELVDQKTAAAHPAAPAPAQTAPIEAPVAPSVPAAEAPTPTPPQQ